MIRDGEEKDLWPLCEMAERFVLESNLPFTFDMGLSKQLFWKAIHDEDAILLVDDQNGVLAGAIFGCMERDFCLEYIAYITKMYVEKEFRGTVKSRDLITAFEERTKKASIIFTSATAGIDEKIEKSFVNLFKKSGYSVLGRVLVKEVS